MKSWSVWAAVLVGVSFACAGDDTGASDKPKSPAAVAAMTKHDVALNRAQIDYQHAVAAADKQYLADLDAAMALALKAANVEEIKRIDAAKKDAQIHSASAGMPSQKLEIEAVKLWQPAFHVSKGQHLRFTATGTWCAGVNERARFTCGPDGREDDPSHKIDFYLEGKIEDGPRFKIGSSITLIAPASGMLYLEMRDDGTRGDNDGSVTVTIASPELKVDAPAGN